MQNDLSCLKSPECFQAILDSASDAIISVDEQQRIILFNRQAEIVFGYSEEEAVGNPLTMLLPLRYRQGHEEMIRKYAGENISRRRGNERIEVAGRRKNGEEFPAEIAISKVWQEGRYIFTAVLRDAAERKGVEARLRRYSAELEQRNQNLEDFAYIASHDLQEPLRKIRALGDRLMALFPSFQDERIGDYIRRIDGASKRMQQLLDALLMFSTATSKLICYEPLDLRSLILEVVSDLEIPIEKTKGRVEIHSLPRIHADRFQMRQLFQNLISNSLKFYKKGEPPVVTVRGHPAGNAAWNILVEDNGIGIEGKYIDLIFKPFERLHANGEFDGNGMGLPICRKIVDLHGGKITVRSSPPIGSQFIVTLPEKNPEAEKGLDSGAFRATL